MATKDQKEKVWEKAKKIRGKILINTGRILMETQSINRLMESHRKWGGRLII